LLKGPEQPVTYRALALESPKAAPPFMIVQDGKIHKNALKQAGYDENWLRSKLSAAGLKGPEQLLFAFVNGETLHMQAKKRWGGRVVFLQTGSEK